VYEGPLLAHNDHRPKADHKHAIRKQFHPQLKKVWELYLSHWVSSNAPSTLKKVYTPGGTIVEQMARNYASFGFNWVPLVNEQLILACSLDILFLRHETARGKIIQGGDIDNRLKTLIDAMRIPHIQQEIGTNVPEAGEDPFFCFLSDDGLITEIKIQTGVLLTPLDPNAQEEPVKLIIRVALRPLQLTDWNMSFA
jgi:hypothetical protein